MNASDIVEENGISAVVIVDVDIFPYFSVNLKGLNVIYKMNK